MGKKLTPEDMNKLPPLGLVPKFVRNHERRVEILEALNRYVEADVQIPLHWVREYNELIKTKDEFSLGEE